MSNANGLIQTFADELFAAERDRKAIPPLTGRAALNPTEAYAIQLANVRRRRDAGERVTGMKVGLTARSVQVMMGVDQPDFGHLFATMAISDAGDCATTELIQPRAEAEIGILINRHLRGPGLTDRDIIHATESLVPMLEIVDSRILDWKIGFVDTVADNGSSARYVLGKKRTPPDGIDARAASCTFTANGELIGTGTGAAILDANPYRAVAWLANELASDGLELPAGSIVMPGALCVMTPVMKRGDVVSADFGILGSVSVRFT